MDRLTRDFLLRGGKMVPREFPDRSSVLELKEPCIVNCTGFGAKHLWQDESLVPVRGQINWMTAQPAARYGVFHNNATAISRRDGVIVQYTGPNDDYGYDDSTEIANRDEAIKAIETLSPLWRNRTQVSLQ